MSQPIHVLPINDLIEHVAEGDECPCGPTSERVDTDHGDEWMIVHHSLDGREQFEEKQDG